MKLEIKDINNTFEGYQRLIDFYHLAGTVEDGNLYVELNGWFAANMSAALGSNGGFDQ